jgi:hypothetical protein
LSDLQANLSFSDLHQVNWQCQKNATLFWLIIHLRRPLSNDLKKITTTQTITTTLVTSSNSSNQVILNSLCTPQRITNSSSYCMGTVMYVWSRGYASLALVI